MLLGYSGDRRARRHARVARPARPAVRGGLQRVPDHGGQAVLLLPRASVIYVRDLLSRYDADALRYYLSVAGPETQDTDFTWSEFRRRNNDELVDSWGNLVNRSVSMAARNVGAVPPPGALTDADARAARHVEGGLRHGRRRCSSGPGRRRRSARRCGSSATPTATCPTRRRGSCQVRRPEDPERMATILHTALQVVDDCKTLLTPFLPPSSQQGARAARRRGGVGGRCREMVEVDEPTAAGQPVVPGDHRRLRPAAAAGSRAAAARPAAGRADAALPQAGRVHRGRGAGPAGEPARLSESTTTRPARAPRRRRSRCRPRSSTATATWTRWVSTSDSRFGCRARSG